MFASELKPILQCPASARSLDWEAVGHLFTFLATPAAQSIVAGIQKLEPARLAIARPGRPLRIERYWDVDFEPDERASEGELVERLRELARTNPSRCIECRDVPVGAFLSGGIDSSAVVATMAAQHSGRRSRPSRSASRKRASTSSPTRATWPRSSAPIITSWCCARTSLRIVEDLTWYLDEPFGDTSAIPTYMVSKLAAEHVKVVLTGDGGDELFAGYDKYLVEDRERAYDSVPRRLRRAAGAVGAAMPEGTQGKRFLQHLALDGAAALSRRVDAVPRRRTATAVPARTPSSTWRATTPPIAPRDPWTPATRLDVGGAVRCDLHSYLPLDILTKVDRMTMAHSIEARPPLLDHRLVEFAATIPAHLRLREGTTKYLFKQAMRGVLPDHIIDRPKQGFAVPLARWFREDLATFARDILLSPTGRQRGLFDLRHVERLLQLNQRGRDLDLQLWTMLSFEMWCRRFLDGRRASAQRCHRNPCDPSPSQACDDHASARRHRRREPRHPRRPGRAGAQPRRFAARRRPVE